MWAGRYQPTIDNPGARKKNYTDHVHVTDEEVDGLDFGSGHLAYQKRVGNALPAYKL